MSTATTDEELNRARLELALFEHIAEHGPSVKPDATLIAAITPAHIQLLQIITNCLHAAVCLRELMEHLDALDDDGRFATFARKRFDEFDSDRLTRAPQQH